MTLNQVYALASDATFQHQCQACALGYAHTVIAEAVGAHMPVYSKRTDFAAAVLKDGCVAMLPRIAYGLAAMPGFSAIPGDNGSANDAAMNSAIITAWNDLSLVTAHDQAT